MSPLCRSLLLLGAFASLFAKPVDANPANKAAFEKHFGQLMAERLQTCAICHVSEQGHNLASLDEFPHNSFGDQIRIAGERLVELGKDDSMVDRIKWVADDDADEDGVSNLVEVLLGSMPGKASDVPAADALEKQANLVASYKEKLERYDWRPFRIVQRPHVPSLPNDWGRNPIDAFIAKGHKQSGLSPQQEARPDQLLRRVYLDLIGLSPSAEQIQSFRSEYANDPLAYDRVVTRLLEHPGYGERWGRHWMDVWRYSDWAGYKDALRESQRHIWHWRDWIVQSLNEDKGYDQMLMQMLAADEMQVDEADLRATGYLARNYFTNRDQWMDNVVKHTSQAFMGITLGCAKCHDHMSDPFEQSEYYALRAVFETYNVRTDRVPSELDVSRNGIPRVYDQSTTAKTYVFTRGDERFPVKEEPISPGAPEVLGGSLQITPVTLNRDATRPDQRKFVIRDLRDAAQARIASGKHENERAAAQISADALDAELDLEAKEADGLDRKSDQWKELAKCVHQLQRDAEKLAAEWAFSQASQKREAAKNALEKAEASKNATAITKAKRAVGPADKQLKSATARLKKADETLDSDLTTKFKPRPQKTYPETSSGRRLAFAQWLIDRQNPLTARVAMNHIWLRHFGRALVPTPNDFGAAGRPPTHPGLLDWLAAELIDCGWSMKTLHRIIVTSDTYRMSSINDDANRAVDPDNVAYWRGPQRRMEGEIVRDNLLHLGGRLDATIGGPDIDQNLAQQSRRRSIYLRHAHEKLVEFVQIFDGPAVSECYTRETSIQPHQALALANSKLSVDAADAIVAQLNATASDDDVAFIQQLFLHILSRPASQSETESCVRFLSESTRPRHNLVLVLLNHNDFVTIR